MFFSLFSHMVLTKLVQPSLIKQFQLKGRFSAVQVGKILNKIYSLQVSFLKELCGARGIG